MHNAQCIIISFARLVFYCKFRCFFEWIHNESVYLEVLHVAEFFVLSVEGDELLVGALFYDATFVEYADEVG